MEQTIQIIRQVFEVNGNVGIGPDTTLADIPGYDSMSGMNLLLELEAQHGVDLSEFELRSSMRIGELHEHIQAQRGM